MALVASFTAATKESQKRHDAVDCHYSEFVGSDGKVYFQLDTHGRADRKIPGKISQTLQFDEHSGRELKRLLELAFPG